jgi:hypothetical protein
LELQARPCATTGALLERWRDRPHIGALAKLATVECLVDTPVDAALLLNQALEKLIQEEIPARRCKELLAKASDGGLSPEERLELQMLLQIRSPVPRN